jgi:hypothetical protein
MSSSSKCSPPNFSTFLPSYDSKRQKNVYAFKNADEIHKLVPFSTSQRQKNRSQIYMPVPFGISQRQINQRFQVYSAKTK